MSQDNIPDTPSSTEAAASSTENTSVTGRSVFLVETTASGIAVQTSFLTEQGQMLQMPAIFPNLEYALNQIDELRRLVSQHFAQAAQVGAQLIAAQSAKSAAQAAASTATASDAPAPTLQ